MSIDESALDGLRQTLAADDYRLAVTETEYTVEIRVTAGPDACEECLIPKPIMRGMVEDALGVPGAQVALTYPTDANSNS